MIGPMYAEWIMMLAAAAIAARTTRLITRDIIASPLRTLIGRLGEHATVFISCPWCVGWWIALGTFAGTYAVWPGHDWSDPAQLLVWTAAAAATNLVYASVASTIARISDLADSTELHLLNHRELL